MISTHDILSHAWPNRGGWRVYGDDITAGDGGPVPTLEEIEAQREVVESILLAQQTQRETRAAGRAALRASWNALPAFIRGPFREKFQIANTFLDEGDDEAALAMIEYAEAPSNYTLEQIAVFVATKATMKTGIENLSA